MKIVVVCIAAEFEKPYLLEWAEWHHSIGFDEVFVMSNNWSVPEEIKQIPFIKTARVDGMKMQLPAYTMFAAQYMNAYDWAFFLDVDEFIYVPSKDIEDLLSKAESLHQCQMSLSWMLFGDGGCKDTSGSVVQRFQRCSGVFANEVKSAVSFKSLRQRNIKPVWVNPHFAACVPGYSWIPSFHMPLNSVIAGSTCKELSGEEVKEDMPFIAHYCTKTKAEWDIRAKIARSDTGTLKDDSQFADCNKNDVYCPWLAKMQMN